MGRMGPGGSDGPDAPGWDGWAGTAGCLGRPGCCGTARTGQLPWLGIESPLAGAAPDDTQSGAATGSRPDSLREGWRAESRIGKYRSIQGWIDAGERLALLTVADDVRGGPVLDLGVGAGRTGWILRLLTERYVGLDWSPEMVTAARAALPGLDVRAGDARDLSAFGDRSFALVFFSYNGIDNLDHLGRDRVRSEAARVLAPGGWFVYSTMSKTGPAYCARPSRRPPRRAGEPTARYAVRAAYHVAASGTRRAERAAWRAAMARATDHGDWATAPLAAVGHELVHFSTVAAEGGALAGHGFDVVAVFGDDGRGLGSGTVASVAGARAEAAGTGADACSWFYMVARKPAAGQP